MQLKNLGNSVNAIKELQNVFSGISNVNQIREAEMSALTFTTSSYSKEVLIASINQKVFTAEQAKAILTAKGLTGTEAEQIITTAGLTASETAATGATNGLSLAWQGLAAKLGISVTALNVAAGALAALAIGVTVYSQYQQAQEEARQAAQEAANTYEETTSSIDDYAKKYEELHTALIKAKGNEEDTYNIKSQLLELQKELNEKFGDEYGKLNLVTDAYKDQTDAIKEFNREAANRYLNTTPDLDTAEEEMTKAGI